MNVIIQIQGREAIPVRAIPLLANWRFMSPDVVAHVLGGTGGSNVSLFGDLESYRVENEQVQPINKDWWVQFPLNQLRALSKKIKQTEPIDEVGYSEWQKLSLKELPTGAFVWKDDYQKLHDKNWNSRFRMTYCALKDWNGAESDEDLENQMQHDLARDLRRDDLVDDNPLKRDLRESLEVLKRWREPDYCPFMGQELSAIVREGFVPQITTELIKQLESAEYKASVTKIENVERILHDAKAKLASRQETLKNAPGTGDIQKLEDAERAVQVAEKALDDADEAHRTMRGDVLEDVQQHAPEQSTATPAPVATASDGPAPLTTSQIASCFDGFHGWDFDRWRENLRSPAPWLKKCQHRAGNQGKPVIESTWWPIEIAKALDKKHSKIRRQLHARFKNKEPLKPWLESIESHLPDEF